MTTYRVWLTKPPEKHDFKTRIQAAEFALIVIEKYKCTIYVTDHRNTTLFEYENDANLDHPRSTIYDAKNRKFWDKLIQNLCRKGLQ